MNVTAGKEYLVILDCQARQGNVSGTGTITAGFDAISTVPFTYNSFYARPIVYFGIATANQIAVTGYSGTAAAFTIE